MPYTRLKRFYFFGFCIISIVPEITSNLHPFQNSNFAQTGKPSFFPAGVGAGVRREGARGRIVEQTKFCLGQRKAGCSWLPARLRSVVFVSPAGDSPRLGEERKEKDSFCERTEAAAGLERSVTARSLQAPRLVRSTSNRPRPPCGRGGGSPGHTGARRRCEALGRQPDARRAAFSRSPATGGTATAPGQRRPPQPRARGAAHCCPQPRAGTRGEGRGLWSQGRARRGVRGPAGPTCALQDRRSQAPAKSRLAMAVAHPRGGGGGGEGWAGRGGAEAASPRGGPSPRAARGSLSARDPGLKGRPLARVTVPVDAEPPAPPLLKGRSLRYLLASERAS